MKPFSRVDRRGTALPPYMLRRLLVLLFAVAVGNAAGSAQARDCDIAAHSAAIPGGTVHYTRAGSGPTVVLLHGLFAQKEQWRDVSCALADAGYAAVAPDLPGYGQSTGFALPDYRLDAQAERLDQFADALGLAGFDVAGNSMGGAIAALYAREHPRRVRTLAFIGAPLGVAGWGREVREAMYAGVNPFIPVDAAQFDIEMRLLFVTPPAVPEEVRDAIVREYERNNRHYTQVWNIVDLAGGVLRGGPGFFGPTLAVWGTLDKVFPIGGAGPLRRRLPGPAFVALHGAGHLPQIEAPDRVAPIYLRFLAAHRGAHPPAMPPPPAR